METSSRDARKRRIAERGSDRLALITGRIQTLPASSSSEPSSQQFPSSPPRNEIPPVSDSDQTSSGSPQDVNKDLSSSLPNHDPTAEPGSGTVPEPVMRKCKARVETSRAAALEPEDKPQPATSDMDPHFGPQTRHRHFFNPTQIVSAISASEGTRIFFSLLTAVFVVLSYVGFPIISSVLIKSVLLSRPLYLVLLTNISMVLGRLLLGKQRGNGGGGVGVPEQDGSGPAAGGSDFADNIGMALEASFVLQNAVGALFMDCSLYAVVVICGVSLAQRLGW
ncbi:hypothetical protein LguiB_027843 [Lonicera macranthoides]